MKARVHAVVSFPNQMSGFNKHATEGNHIEVVFASSGLPDLDHTSVTPPVRQPSLSIDQRLSSGGYIQRLMKGIVL